EIRAAVERDHAGLVNPLGGDRDRVRALKDANAVAVDRRTHAAIDPERDAAVVEREVLESVERPGAESAPARRRLRSLPAGLAQRRRPTVGRIDDQRREAERARAPLVAQERLFVHRAIAARLLRARALEELLLRQELLRGELARAIARNAAHVVGAPRAFE